MKQPNGVIIYRGPSVLDGAPIVAIATGLVRPSANAKTGPMIQTWILREDVSPVDAVNTGQDVSICGQCPHRGRLAVIDGRVKNVERPCYVLVHRAPLTIYKSYKRGNYANFDSQHEEISKLFANLVVRIGSYGDPAAVPSAIWEALTKHAKTFTGYTHQWRTFPELAPYCMASIDTPSEKARASALGFRTYRVTAGWDPMQSAELGEILCPAAEEAGRKTTCADCSLCKGTTSSSRVSIVIPTHGGGANHFTGE